MTEHRPSSIETEDPDWATTTFVGVLGTVVLVIVIVFVQGLYGRKSRSEWERKVVAEEPREYRELKAKQLAQLHEARWVDRENGIVAIPIEKAMALMAADPDPAAPVRKKP